MKSYGPTGSAHATFTWGYAGWGNASRHFVQAVDAHERLRGFEPPVFVDLRIRRNVRAADFQGNRFARIVGPTRYVWLPDLGNKRIQSREGAWIQIKRPGAAVDLLERLLEYRQHNRRAILFCSCLEPLQGDGISFCCHRIEVARLLVIAARSRGFALDVQEWPGDAPSHVVMSADAGTVRSLAGHAKYIPLGAVAAALPAHASLGWGSTVRLSPPHEQYSFVTGPAYVRRGRWALKSLQHNAWLRYDLHSLVREWHAR